MNLLDLALVVALIAAAAGGWRLGFVARTISWAGMALGIYLGSRLLPSLVSSQSDASAQSVLLLVLVVLVGAGLIGQLFGYVLGAQLRIGIRRGAPEYVDRTGGAVAGVVGVLFAFWLLLPLMADTPGWPAQQARGSTLAGAIADHFPRPPDTMRALRELVGEDVFPRVLDGLGQAPELGPPPPESGLDPTTAEHVAESTVQVESSACSRLRDGSGSVLGNDLVVTNAHVVAGATSTRVFRYPDGDALNATIVAFDPDRDLAVLDVPGINRPALPLDGGDFGVGGTGAVFGHPGGGPLKVRPFSVGREVQATGRDIYDDHRTRREVFFLSAELAPGDSGGPLVDAQGTVVGVAFAIAPDQRDVAYALTVDEVKPVLESVASGPVDAGPCLGG